MIARSLLACQPIERKGDERNTYALDEWGFGILLPDCGLRIFCQARPAIAKAKATVTLICKVSRYHHHLTLPLPQLGSAVVGVRGVDSCRRPNRENHGAEGQKNRQEAVCEDQDPVPRVFRLRRHLKTIVNGPSIRYEEVTSYSKCREF